MLSDQKESIAHSQTEAVTSRMCITIARTVSSGNNAHIRDNLLKSGWADGGHRTPISNQFDKPENGVRCQVHYRGFSSKSAFLLFTNRVLIGYGSRCVDWLPSKLTVENEDKGALEITRPVSPQLVL